MLGDSQAEHHVVRIFSQPVFDLRLHISDSLPPLIQITTLPHQSCPIFPHSIYHLFYIHPFA